MLLFGRRILCFLYTLQLPQYNLVPRVPVVLINICLLSVTLSCPTFTSFPPSDVPALVVLRGSRDPERLSGPLGGRRGAVVQEIRGLGRCRVLPPRGRGEAAGLETGVVSVQVQRRFQPVFRVVLFVAWRGSFAHEPQMDAFCVNTGNAFFVDCGSSSEVLSVDAIPIYSSLQRKSSKRAFFTI